MLTWETANKLFVQIEQASNDAEYIGLKKELFAAACRYARARTDWASADAGERMAMDAGRTAAHNAFIDACNILSRFAAKRGYDNAWRQTLGADRKDIGDFACYLHAILGIAAR